MQFVTAIGFSLFSLALLTFACEAQDISANQSTLDVADADEIFLDKISPILINRCWECHSGGSPEKGLRLDTPEGILKGGESGLLIDKTSVEKSRLFEVISGPEPAMPADGKPLESGEVDAIKQWIASGAKVPRDWPVQLGRLPTNHWSFQKILRPEVPSIRDQDWPINEIDHFILAQLEERGLVPSPPADRRTLLRRLTFDMSGLPPEPELALDFSSGTKELSYEICVDKLLASPRYGERWARHWLDVVRFAESNGFETNLPRDSAWPYRDYVIRAFNEDIPYDRFVLEQLAGDVLGVDEATGFLVAGCWDQVKSPDPVLTLNQRADELHDIVSTTGSAFLGLTVGCARCHDHKFDPIPQTDYYALVACFAGVQHGERPLPSARPADVENQISALKMQLASLEKQLWGLEPLAVVASEPTDLTSAATVKRGSISARRNVDRFNPVSAKWLKFTILRTNSLEPCLDELEVFASDESTRNVALAAAGTRATASSVYPNSDIHRLEHINDGRFGNSHSWISNEPGQGWVELEFPDVVSIDRVVWARDREQQFTDRLAAEYRIEISTDHETWHVVATSADRVPLDAAGSPKVSQIETQTSDPQRNLWIKITGQRDSLEKQLVELTRVRMAYAGTFAAEPDDVHRLYRGDPTQRREVIAPGVLTASPVSFDAESITSEPQRRLALGHWIVDPANPLTARVIVNRLWQFHFGEGLVSTPSDFGANGQPPSHPELLDWLASELIDHHWSLKHIQRLILTSRTFRQASDPRPDGISQDAASRMLWRFPPRRLEAEPIRDSILAASGKLDLRMGGPGFNLFEPNDNYVRVYEPLRTFGPGQWRRMVYATVIRQRLDGVFGAFDCPDGSQIAPKRNRSTTPLQALNLLNSEFMLEQATFFSERLIRESGTDLDAQICRAFDLAFQRAPSVAELTASKNVATQFGMAAVCHALFGSNEFVYLY